ncbi:phenylalanine--tRNA ligase subunit beta [Salisediminibacterium halotolerans]|uniref:Phenylalanine--tRNA ligase beta subunit n=1 Tax=Salisediminibacterium halotolerans TaxID=517425 RepID=A0A1H9U0Z7_9BACI|nr:phenylalanine--tRNA ligase subunit beta [Salisediminibacterium haloalkalitolerans]SES03116.1 phenylalanyl-tRNA synthetase beta chain [Salisediminibacterium haloalkalitolerans]
MLVSYQWLQKYVDLTDLTAEETAEKLTRSGVEVDAMTNLSEEIDGLAAGYVEACEPHPDADKLSVCRVDIGEDAPAQIVCGADNVAGGQYVAVAKVGGTLPGGMKIKRAKLRGQTSEGMICSLQELGFESKLIPKKYSGGIFVFPEPVTPGSDALSLLGLNDTVFELDLTPNRSDCLSMLGVAYETAAILGRSVKKPEMPVTESSEPSGSRVRVDVAAAEANPYYGATVIENITIKESPLWLQMTLMAAGIRPLNNVVDITNYVLLEYGQPLHAFDFDRFNSDEVLVRYAENGEQMTTLDEETRVMQADHLLITNGKTPVAMAGVMGGATSEVQNDTKNVLLEAAYFDPVTVRKASRDHGLRSDSSVRFEKGVDPQRVRDAGKRAASLIEELAGGRVLLPPEEFDQLDRSERQIRVSLTQINGLLGTDLTVEDAADVFRRLQFAFEISGETFAVDVPTRRQDIFIEADLIEEVARLYGYDRIPVTLPNSATTPGKLSDRQKKQRQTRRFFENTGMHEAVSYSLTSAAKEARIGIDQQMPRVDVALPMSEERSALRTTLVPHLLDALEYNKNRNEYNVHLYELGSVFLTEQTAINEQPDEKTYISGAFMGRWFEHAWQNENRDVDFFAVKGVLEGLFAELNTSERIAFVQTEKEGFHPGQTAAIMADGKEIGFVAQLHPSVAKTWSLPAVFVFEIDFDELIKGEMPMSYQPVPRFPAIDRDIALIVDKTVSAEEVADVIRREGGSILTNVALFDVYEGEHIESGKKSLAFSLRYLDPEKTLKEEDVTDVHETILKALYTALGAELRQ